MCSNGKKALKVQIGIKKPAKSFSKRGFTTILAFILATIVSKEIPQTKTSFLANQDMY